MHKIEIEIDKVRTSETAVATESDGTSEARGRRLESGIRVTEREREKWEYMQGIEKELKKDGASDREAVARRREKERERSDDRTPTMKRARETKGRRKIADMWRTQTERVHGVEGWGVDGWRTETVDRDQRVAGR